MAQRSHREQLIQTGVALLHQRGFTASGVRDITAAASVPQGSFTNHFRSKEEFATVVLDRYFERLSTTMDATLRNPTRSPIDRLLAYFDTVAEALKAAGWRYGCLVANMAMETSELSEPIRLRLGEIAEAQTDAFADTVREGQRLGTITDQQDAHDLAAVLLAAWQGTLLRMKVERTARPVERFRTLLVGMLAPQSSPASHPTT